MHDTHSIRALMIGLSVATMFGCGGGPDDFDVVTSKLARETAPQVADADFTQFQADNADFALELYHELRQGASGENLLYSPHSISSALAMTYAGAKGDTAAQMAEALNFSLAPEALHPSFNKLDLELASREDAAGDLGDVEFTLRVVNALWGEQSQAFEQPFLDTLALNYGAGIYALDFVNRHERSRETINAWVEQQTEERIKDLLPAGSIDPATSFVLTNAVYFNSAWTKPFDDLDTRPATFTTPTGEVTTDFMTQESSFVVGEAEDGTTVVELPYDGDELSMVILMPADGKFDDTEAALTGASFESYRAAAQMTDSVQLSMPKFEFESEKRLSGPLRALGMVDAFAPGAADFSGITGSGGVYIDEVYHKAFIAVDEKGTEAAAATAVVGRNTSAPPPPEVIITLDRPFVFAIRDTTGALLFVGRVLDPS